MAEGLFRKYSPQGFEPLSAGTRPVSSINPVAIEVMREVGIDISKQKSKLLTEDMIKKAKPISYPSSPLPANGIIFDNNTSSAPNVFEINLE